MRIIHIFSLLSFLFSCAHKLEKEKERKISFSEDLLLKVMSSSSLPTRTPAQSEVGKSNQRIYFSTLYYQYKTLGRLVKEKSTLSVCPQYHHDRLEVDSYYLPEIHYQEERLSAVEKNDYFPETIFSHRGELEEYFVLIENEVKELCELGRSDNFYKFDNLITYHIGREDFHKSVDSMRAVLKIPIFANYYLFSMMRGPFERDYTPSKAKEFISRAKTYWFDQYVLSAQKGRQEIFAKR